MQRGLVFLSFRIYILKAHNQSYQMNIKHLKDLWKNECKKLHVYFCGNAVKIKQYKIYLNILGDTLGI